MIDVTNRLIVRIALLSVALAHFTLAQTCQPLDPKLFPSCVDIGHTHTFYLPSSVDQAALSTLLQSFQNKTSKCTVEQNVPDAIYCAVFLPLCVDGRKQAFSPCRRVCAEFVSGCQNVLEKAALEYFGAMCNVLPDSKPETNECFEPANFRMSSNLTDFSNLGKCHRRLLPMCGNLGYNYTTLSNETQRYTLKVAFNKDLDSPSLNESDFSLPAWLEKQLSKYKSECVSVLRKLYCAQWLPPCFPEENSSQFYGLCKPECETIHHLCPGFFDEHPLEVSEFCSEFPEEKPVHNFCEHTQWPQRTPYNFSVICFIFYCL